MATCVVRRSKPKLLVFITTGTFNLLSKIRAVDPPKWDRLGSRSGLATECPRTYAPTASVAFATDYDRRERLCQNIRCSRSRQAPIFQARFNAHCGSNRLAGILEMLVRQFSKNHQQLLKPISACEDFSSGLAMVMFSAGFPTGVRGTCLASPYEPASFPY